MDSHYSFPPTSLRCLSGVKLIPYLLGMIWQWISRNFSSAYTGHLYKRQTRLCFLLISIWGLACKIC